MKFYKNLLFLFILTNFCTANAQTNNGTIIGLVADIQNVPVKDVTVYLLRSADSSVVKFTICNKDGKFEFNDLQPGSYLIKVTDISYIKTTTKVYRLNRSVIVDVGVIKLQLSNNQLGQIDVVASKPFIENKPGKRILNIQNSVTSTGSNALEILKKSPGVKVDNDNTISLEGKGNVLVLIDNKPTYMPPDALIDMLQATPSSMIDQIELINSPGAKYDAANGGVINIKLVRSEGMGINGSANVTNGAQQISNDHGSRFRSSTGFNFNWRLKNLDVFGNYAYTYTPYNRIFITDRLVNYKGLLTEVNADYFSDQSKASNVYQFGADYNFSPKHIIGFLVRGLTNSFTLKKSTTTNIANQGVRDSSVATTAKLDSKAAQVAVDLNYKGNFDKAGELSVDLDYFSYNRSPLEMINSDYFNVTNVQPYRSLAIQNSFPSNFKIYTSNIVYDVNLSKTSSLSVVAKTDYVKTHNNLDFGEIVNKVYQPDPRFTNQFDFTETVKAGAVTYNYTPNKKLSFEAGLRVEQTTSEGVSPTNKTDVKNNYLDFFPDVKITDKLNNNNVLHLTYGRSIYRPFYTDLNPFIAYQDQYSYYMGNPYLKPVYIDVVQLQHLYKDKFSVSLQFAKFHNFIMAVFSQNDSSKILITHKSNLGNRYVYSFNFNGEFDPVSWWEVNAAVSGSYQWLTANPAEAYLNHTGIDLDLLVKQIFHIGKSFKIGFDSEYEIPTTYGVNQYKSAYNFDGNITKNISKQATLALNVNDIFNSKRNRFTSNYSNLNVTGTDQTEFRTILLSFTYKFGNKTVKAERSRHTGAEAEQIRAGSGNNPQ
ncbi:hypothetical protein BEL04_06730 [Mucilaginibacter sp. PPCGB 2223]|uniref:outer membrane beta-barrel family protein n=1 Tax=Mucilaginibacter sp. PPCGB 2223 TaxID=1886027 RepID=UPI000825CC61|nr:outer membrane beta-barrel family protein [Mucilaginibacter sp. PPCGB 2223]OCX53966.1 hypothetical protein BEL04_06730 [Mucilaginibacter sp. PPCGB 2223]